jgi:hypothetical protein
MVVSRYTQEGNKGFVGGWMDERAGNDEVQPGEGLPQTT